MLKSMVFKACFIKIFITRSYEAIQPEAILSISEPEVLRLYRFITMKRSLSFMYIRVKYDIEVLPLQMMFFFSK